MLLQLPGSAGAEELRRFSGGSGAEAWSLELPASYVQDTTVSPVLLPSGSTLGVTPQALPGFGPAPPPNPMKGRWASPAAVVSVGVRKAAELRPTFLQTNDVTQFGSLDEAASLLVPPGAHVTTSADEEVDLRHYYSYGFEARNGAAGCLTATARAGRVLIALSLGAPGSSTTELCSLVGSFRLTAPGSTS